jgi:hypothetical protein
VNAAKKELKEAVNDVKAAVKKGKAQLVEKKIKDETVKEDVIRTHAEKEKVA